MINKQTEMTDLKKKILKGLDLVSIKLIENARQQKLKLVVIRDNKIVHLNIKD